LDEDGAPPGAVELAKVDLLPSAEGQTSGADRDELRRPHEAGLDVRVGIALRVMKAGILRHKLAQVGEHVALHVRVRALVDGDARRGVRGINQQRALGHGRGGQSLGDLHGDVHELLAAGGGHVEPLLSPEGAS